MSHRHLSMVVLALPGLLVGCSGGGDQGHPPASAATAPAPLAAPAATTPPATTTTAAPAMAGTVADAAAPVSLATDESCRELALHTIRQHDAKADRVFLDDSTPAGRYHRDGNAISGAHGQYRTDAGWTALTSFRCTVDASGKATAFEYQAGKAQTWAEMSDRR